MKVALFRMHDQPQHVYPGSELVEQHCKQDVRVTEYVEVVFPELPADAIQAARERARAADIEYHQRQLNELLRQEGQS